MKILYSQIKQLIPSLAATPAEIGAALTMTGFMQESLETVNYNNQADVLLGFEIRQNRPDCLSVIGLAREIAALANTKGGILIIGVDDDGTVVGVRSEKSEIDIVEQACGFYVFPPIEPEIEIIEYKNKDV